MEVLEFIKSLLGDDDDRQDLHGRGQDELGNIKTGETHLSKERSTQSAQGDISVKPVVE